MKETTMRPKSGWTFLLTWLVLLIVPLPAFGFFAASFTYGMPAWLGITVGLSAAITTICAFFGLFGCLPVQPNEARVLLLFGEYRGTISESGFFWVNPFYTKKKISLRVRNFETGSITTAEQKDAAGRVIKQKERSLGRPSKVNDQDGNPIEISAIVVWKVVNTAEALFEVDDYEDYVAVQSEAALRNLASRHPYDRHDDAISLRGNTQEICDQLRHDIQARLDKAGVDVVEARISHLAYAQEIAAAMLQRQQAQAVVAARTTIVEGAVGMVHMALEHLAKDNIVDLDDDKRASMVSNLLVVLCGDRHTQPVINTGSIY